jgi:hypothetical protein
MSASCAQFTSKAATLPSGYRYRFHGTPNSCPPTITRVTSQKFAGDTTFRRPQESNYIVLERAFIWLPQLLVSGEQPLGPRAFRSFFPIIGVYADQNWHLTLLLQTRCISPMHRSRRHRSYNHKLPMHLDFRPCSRTLIMKDVTTGSPKVRSELA